MAHLRLNNKEDNLFNEAKCHSPPCLALDRGYCDRFYELPIIGIFMKTMSIRFRGQIC